MKKREWTAALRKVGKEGACRVCLKPGWYPHWPLDCAHTVGRKYQDVPLWDNTLAVQRDAVIPLCRMCHKAYDERRLSLIGYLTMPEYRNAVAACKRNGLDARRRLSGGRSRRAEKEEAS